MSGLPAHKKIIFILLIVLTIVSISMVLFFSHLKRGNTLLLTKNLVSTSTLSQKSQGENEVTFTLKAVGPLEPENLYPELNQNPNLSEEVRAKLNKQFKEEADAISCLYGEGTRELLVEMLQRDAMYNEDLKKRLLKVDLKTIDDEALRKLYVELEKPQSYGAYRIDTIRNNFIFGMKGSADSWCGWEAHPSHGSSPSIIDLTTGNDVTLGDVVIIDKNFYTLLQQKIDKEYKARGGENDEENICFQHLHAFYLTSYESDVEMLQKENFVASTTTFSILPSSYPSAIEGPCGDTEVIFSYPELSQFVKDNNLLYRLSPNTLR